MNAAPAGGRIGVLLVNLGTPDATDYWSVRRYLKGEGSPPPEFLARICDALDVSPEWLLLGTGQCYRAVGVNIGIARVEFRTQREAVKALARELERRVSLLP